MDNNNTLTEAIFTVLSGQHLNEATESNAETFARSLEGFSDINFKRGEIETDADDILTTSEKPEIKKLIKKNYSDSDYWTFVFKDGSMIKFSDDYEEVSLVYIGVFKPSLV